MDFPVDSVGAGALDTHTVPLLVKILPDAPTVVMPVPPRVVDNVPVTPVVNGNPVQFVRMPLVGVPNRGVTSNGDVNGAFKSNTSCSSAEIGAFFHTADVGLVATKI